MAASAGAGGLSALGWVVVAGGVAVAGAAGLYFSGVLKPEVEPVAEVKVEGEQVAVADPDPEPASTMSADVPKPEAKAPATAEPSEPESVEDTAQTDETPAQPEVSAAESEQVAETVETAQADVPVEEQTAEAEAEVAAEPEAVPEPTVPPLEVPALDTIRIEPDGSAVLAGKAAPGSELSVHLDGAEIERVQVDRSGVFALFLTLPFSDDPRGLSLIAELDGQTAQSGDYLLAALPNPQPVQVAEAKIAPEEEAPQAEAQQAASRQEVETGSEEPQTDTAQDTTEAPQETENRATAEPAPETEAANTVIAQAQDTAPQPVQVTEAEHSANPEPVQQVEQAVEAAAPSENAAAETTSQVATHESSEPGESTEPDEAASTDVEPVTYETASQTGEAVKEEPRAVAILKSDESGVELVQAPTPTEPDAKVQIALDTIGYSDAGDVQLTGRATQGALVRVYLNNLAVSDVVTDNDGRWRGVLDDVTPGIYTLRVDELGPGDVVLSRLETPFKREAPAVLQPKEPEPGVTRETPAIRAVTVQKGDTLWAISRERYGDGVLYVKVFEANRGAIRNPDLIYPGQVFNIPE